MRNTTTNARRKYIGIALLSKGYRPFFLMAGIWAVLSLFLWLFMLTGLIILPSAFSPLEWHMHEMIFGYSSAVIAGFLLTAVPNWTGRFPISGNSLLVLVLVWLVGRAVVLFSSYFDAYLVMVIDLIFPVLLSLAISIEIFAGKNWRNLRVLIVLLGFALSNLFFHFEIIINGAADYSFRLGVVMVLIMIMVIGGRIIPSFTRNWLVRFNLYDLPAPFSKFDYICMIISIVALIAWVGFPTLTLLAILLALAGLLNLVRLYRWAGIKTVKEPMVLVLHIAYLFIPLGFLALAFSIIFPNILPQAGATHFWTAGAIGMMSIAMMSRVSLAHGGQRPEADKIISAIYLTLFLSVITRFLAAFFLQLSFLIHISATLWITAFLIFIIRYWRVLV